MINNMSKKEKITPNFELVFGGFGRKEDSFIKGEIVNGEFRRKYPSEAGKLCKNVFSEEEEQTKISSMSKKKNTTSSFELVFGEPFQIKGERVNGDFRRKYPPKVGKLCKNVFPEEEEEGKK